MSIGQMLDAGQAIVIEWRCRAWSNASQSYQSFQVGLPYGVQARSAMAAKIRQVWGGDWAVVEASQISI